MKKNIGIQVPSLLLLITLVGFPQISETIFTPSLPDISHSFGISMNTTQLTMSIYFFAFAFGVFFWGWLSDRSGRRPAMIYGIIVYGIGSLGCYLAHSIELLLLARFVQAFGASTGSITTQTILRESFSGKQRHRLFAQISAALAFTPAIGPLVGGIVGEFYGFRAVFFTLVLMSLIIFLYSFYRLPETTQNRNTNEVNLFEIIRTMIKNPRVLTYGFLIGSLNGILFSYYAEAPFIFTDYFQLSTLSYGFLGIVVALATVVGALLSKRLLETISPEKIIILGIYILLLGAVLLLTLSYLVALSDNVQMIGMLGSIFILLAGVGMTLPNCLSLALTDFQHVIGSAGAVFSLGYYFLVSIVTFGISILHNGSLLVMPVYFLVIGLIMLGLSRKLMLK